MKLRVLPCLLLCLLLLSGCTAQAEPVEATFFAMDTIMTLRVYGGDQALLDRLQGRSSGWRGCGRSPTGTARFMPPTTPWVALSRCRRIPPP